MSAVAICIRVDAVAVLYAVFLGILLLLSRRGNARIWPLYVLALAILLPLQYFSALGFPLGLCIGTIYFLIGKDQVVTFRPYDRFLAYKLL